jgi:hypothetical protein
VSVPALSLIPVWRRLAILLLVGLMICLPAAVRATQPLHQPSSTTIRLNRGFDVPVEKQLVAPTDNPSLVPATLAQQQPSVTVALRRNAFLADALPDSPDIAAPDPLRGPPTPVVA